MSFTIGLLIALGVIALLLVGPGILRILPGVGAAAAGGASLAKVIGVVVGAIVFITMASRSTMAWEFWATLAALIGASFFFRGTPAGKWSAGFVVAFLIGYSIYHGALGDKAGEVAKKNQEELARAALPGSGAPPTPAQPAQAVAPAASMPTTPANQAGGTRSGPVTSGDGITVYARYELTAKPREWTPRVPIVRGRCVAWFTQEPGSPGIIARTTERARPKDDGDWEEHLDGSPSHCAKTPRYWVEARSAGDTETTVHLEIRKSGQCGACP